MLTGPTALKSTIITDYKPLSEVRKTLRPKWYRVPIDPTTLRALSQRSDLRGAFQALGHLGLWLTTGLLAYYCFSQQWWIGFAILLILHGSVGFFFKPAHHELCHATVFRTKWLNSFFLRVFSLFGWQNFRIYQMSHSYHHRFTLFPEADREDSAHNEPSLRILYLLQLFTVNITGGRYSMGLIPTLRKYFKMAFNRFDTEWQEALYEGQPEERRKAVNWARWVLFFHGGVLVVSLGIGEPILAVLISGHAFFGNWHGYFLNATQHVGLRTNVSDFRKCTRSIRLNPLSEFLYWYMNWHVEHHMYAGVPCYNLSKVHQIVADEMPPPKTLLETWKEMRQTWKRQQIDPDYEYDLPVPPQREKQSKRGKDPMETSMGDLAPQSLSSL